MVSEYHTYMRDAPRQAVRGGGVGGALGIILRLRLDSVGDEELLQGSTAGGKSAEVGGGGAGWGGGVALTWPGYTLRVKSLFSCTSLLGVTLNLSAMLLRESSAPTCSQGAPGEPRLFFSICLFQEDLQS